MTEYEVTITVTTAVVAQDPASAGSEAVAQVINRDPRSANVLISVPLVTDIHIIRKP